MMHSPGTPPDRSELPWLADAPCQAALHDVLGYLNFASGARNSCVARRINELWRRLEEDGPSGGAWRLLGQLLKAQLAGLQGHEPAFEQVDQARTVLEIAFDHVPRAYRRFHADLLAHQSEEELWRPLFLVRIFEAVLQEGAPWEETERITAGALRRLNDFLGYRPVAVLQTPQRIEPYPHEWVSPIGLYWRDAGVAPGRYQVLVERALELLRQTDSELVEQACFNLERLDELAVDPRAYDFDHPVNKRPNYQFGQWDPLTIDGRGFYRRFVLVGVTLDALLGRVGAAPAESRDEFLTEAAAVLAGTMLMAAGTSGQGPDTHDSSVTLATLLPRIARYRDAFYQRLLMRTTGPHGERLQAEAARLRQPFGGARQDLNQRLARHRAAQLESVHLAQLFARMGFPEAALARVGRVPAVSARFTCEIQCRLTLGHRALDERQLERGIKCLEEIRDLVRRGINCGAFIDPWNILGFQAQFSLFPAVENTIHDHRADALVGLLRRTFELASRLESESAALGKPELTDELARQLSDLADWWDRYASVEVSAVEGFSGRDCANSSRQVAVALTAWRKAGGAAANIAFWREHAGQLRSANAYALVVESLLDKDDLVAAMALLMHWLSQSQWLPLAGGGCSFHDLAGRWMRRALRPLVARAAREQPSPEAWQMARKFFDYAEANAESYWEVPEFQLASDSGASTAIAGTRGSPTDAAEDDEADHLFDAAYEEVIYRDSTADGIDAEMLEGRGAAPTSDLEFDAEAERLSQRLAFLATTARLWKFVATVAATSGLARDEELDVASVLTGWHEQACHLAAGLQGLLRTLETRRIPRPSGTAESLVEYDRRRSAQLTLLEKVIFTAVNMSDAARYLLAACADSTRFDSLPDTERAAVAALSAIMAGRREIVPAALADLRQALAPQALLYVPLAAGGAPAAIVTAQGWQRLFLDLVSVLPRLGFVLETCRLLSLAQDLELSHPVGKGAVSEFDRLFRHGFRAMVESIVESASQWPAGESPDAELIENLEPLTETLLRRWLRHSRALRLTVLERVSDREAWRNLVRFVETYGGDLFTQQFFHIGNLRAILHEGVGTWLEQLAEQPDPGQFEKLLGDLDRKLPRKEAISHLEVILEAVLENFAEYKDYNNIAVQSDRGELLYTLLDLLRLKGRYDRVAWNLKPVFLAHEILMRHGRHGAAELWSEGFSQKTAEAADWHMNRLAELNREYGLQLPTIADHLGEGFVRGLALDRIRSLVPKAIAEKCQDGESPSFVALEQELAEFTETPTGAGLDIPRWLVALEHEVDRALDPDLTAPAELELLRTLPSVLLDREALREQLQQWHAEVDGQS
ncbi:MAG: hypothetical protein K2Y37_21400 [Pirellulales bacterium]|nr:hypothetical protein [Pirellulales bacterium]